MSDYNGRNRHREYVEKLRNDYPSKAVQYNDYSNRSKTQTRIRRPKARRARRMKGFLSFAMLTAGWVTAIAAIGPDLYRKRVQENQPISLQQALQNGQTVENLGISQETADAIINLEETIKDENLSREELENLAGPLEATQFKVIKEKAGDLLGENPENIEVWTHSAHGNSPESQELKIDGKDGTEVYTRSDINIGRNIMSQKIADYIYDIGDTQSLDTASKTDKELIELYEEKIAGTSQFAAGEMKLEKRNHIVLEQTTQKDLELKEVQEKKAEAEARHVGFDR